jgi:hypothetical protein
MNVLGFTDSVFICIYMEDDCKIYVCHTEGLKT